MSENNNIKDIHPDLEPINGAPSLFSFYGCGLKLFGNRDYSAETQSSIKTLYFSLFYIPLIPLKAYRVVQDGKRFYFLGKVPVSKTARNGSLATVAVGALAIFGFGGQQYLSSDNYKFGKTVTAAETATAEARYADAMGLYKTIYDDSGSYRSKARDAMAEIMAPAKLSSVPTGELANVLETYNTFGVSPLPRMDEGIYEMALERVKTADRTEPVSLHKLLHGTEDLKDDGEDLSELDAALVAKINAADPTNLEAAVEIAEPSFYANDLETVKRVLDPVKDKLGDSEGARMLAQIYISEGRTTEAYPLLSDYTSARLETFQKAEARLDSVTESLWDSEFFKLQNGLAPDAFYEAYDKAPKTEQQLMVDTHLSEAVYNKPKYLDALKVYQESAAVVPVAMDFGVLQLRRAEGLSSQAERNAELEAAEKTFLSIKGAAGDSDEYKVYLGQVYFWLGKQDEGQALFDEVLEANGRSSESLLSIALTLRSLGKTGLAEELTQEAYENAADDKTRYNAANVMNLLSSSLEDKVKWLERSDPNAASVQASLKETKGQIAANEGDTKSAIKYFREAIQHSETLPDNAVTFNNRALTYFAIHGVTGDRADFKKGADLMSEAVSQRADDSILLGNAADTLLTSSLYEVLPDTLQFDKLQSRPSPSDLSYFYRDAAEKARVISDLKANADFNTATEYLERTILLAPNNVDNYTTLGSLYFFLDDTDALESLGSRMAENQIDISTNASLYEEYLQSDSSEDDLAKLKARETRIRDQMTQNGLNVQTKGALQFALSRNLQSQVMAGEESRMMESVQLAKQAARTLPSSRTESQYAAQLMSQASLEASAKFPAYKSLRDKWGKAYSDSYLVGLVMGEGGEVSDWFKNNAAFKQSIQIERDALKKFPESTSPYDWAMFKAIDDPLADMVAANIKGSALRKAMIRQEEISSPYAGSTLAESLWMREIDGKSGLSDDMKAAIEAFNISAPESLLE